jgi:hypothetical protein
VSSETAEAREKRAEAGENAYCRRVHVQSARMSLVAWAAHRGCRSELARRMKPHLDLLAERLAE